MLNVTATIGSVHPRVFAATLAVFACVAAADAQVPTELQGLLDLQPSPGAQALLLGHSADPRVRQRWGDALRDADVDRRAAAARMIGIAGAGGDIERLRVAATDEQDPIAKREMLRALAIVGSEHTDQTIYANLPAGSEAHRTALVLASTRPRSLVTHILAGGNLGRNSDYAADIYARLLQVAPAEATRLEQGVASADLPKALQGMLHMAHSTARRISTPLLIAGLQKSAATAGEVLAYLPAVYGHPEHVAADDEVVTAYAAMRSRMLATGDTTHDVALAMADRWFSRTSPSISELLPALSVETFSALLMPSAAYAVLSDGERGALVAHLGWKGDARSAVTSARFAPAQAPSQWPAAASPAHTLSDVPAAMLADLQRLTRCTGRRAQHDRAASITYRPDGRPLRASVDSMDSLPPECVAFAQMMIRVTYGPASPPGASPSRTVLRLDRDWVACSATREADERRAMSAGPTPPSRERPPQPRKLKDQAPIYPPDAQRAMVSGTVLVEATVTSTGCVGGARVVQSVPSLDLAALQAVTYWEYAPVKLSGQPVSFLMTANVKFALP